MLLAYDWLLVVMTVVFAGVAAWGDLRPMLPHLAGRTGYEKAAFGRISNRLLLIWLAVALLLVVGSVWWVRSGGRFLAWEWVESTEGTPYLLAWGVNALFALSTGFLLWVLNLWAAGDGKLFALIALSLPLSMYKNSYIPWFPSFVLFFNTFVAMLGILLVEFLVSLAVRALRQGGAGLLQQMGTLVSKLWANRWAALKLVVLFLALFTTVRILRHFLRAGLDEVVELNKTVVYVLLFLMFRPLRRLAEKPAAFVVSLVIIVSYAVYGIAFEQTGSALGEFVNIGWLAMSVIVFRLAYDAYLKSTDSVAISWRGLRKGMVIADSSLRTFRERREFFSSRLGEIGADGLSQSQVDALSEWFAANEPEGQIFVSRTIPFAPALLLGTLLTVIWAGLVWIP